MTQNEKDLLLKDLCARLPYGVKMNHIADSDIEPKTLIGIAKDMITLESSAGYSCVDVEHYKPYLFPMSIMTEEQNLEYLRTCMGGNAGVPTLASFEWCDKNHFDYRGLIPMGIAMDATGKNIY